MVALGKNTNVHTQAALVLSLFAHLLGNAEAPVRYWAMVALMDMSPRRLWFDARLKAQDVDPIYPGIVRVAKEFIQKTKTTLQNVTTTLLPATGRIKKKTSSRRKGSL